MSLSCGHAGEEAREGGGQQDRGQNDMLDVYYQSPGGLGCAPVRVIP
jgi:hypothetical protein